jgi:hypothetical protein
MLIGMVPLEIGRVRQEFKPGLENLVAGVIIGLLLIGGGGGIIIVGAKTAFENRAGLPLWADKGPSWGAALLMSAIAIAMIVGGTFLIQWMRSLWSLRVHLGEKGFAVSRQHDVDVFLWNQIESVTETHVFERPPLLKGPAQLLLPKVQSKRYSVKRKDDKEFFFDANAIRSHDMLAGFIKRQTDPLSVPWGVVEEHI